GDLTHTRLATTRKDAVRGRASEELTLASGTRRVGKDSGSSRDTVFTATRQRVLMLPQKRMPSDAAIEAVLPAMRPRRLFAFGIMAAAFAVVAADVMSGGSSSAEPPRRAASAQKGQLRVTSEPTEALVFWDGRFLGKTPLTVSMPEGRQTVTVTRTEFLDE